LNIVGGDRLKPQVTRREICKNLRFGSHCTTWPYAKKIIGIDVVKRRSISTKLCLNTLVIDLSYGLVNAPFWRSLRALPFRWGDAGCGENQKSYDESRSHGEVSL